MKILERFVAWWNAEPPRERKKVQPWRAAPSDHFDQFGNYRFKDPTIGKAALIAKRFNASMVTFPSTSTSTLPYSVNWTAAVYGGGVWVTYNSNGATNYVACSTNNGATWTSATLPSSATWATLTYGGGVFVMTATASGSGTNVAAYSTNGSTWTAATMPATAKWTNLVYCGSTFVATSSSSTASAYTTNGSSWTAGGTMPTTTPAGTLVCSSTTIVGGNSGAIFYSTNGGSTWTTASTGGLGSSQLFYGGGAFICATQSSSTAGLYSSNGTTWSSTTFPTPSGSYWSFYQGQAAYGAGTIVVMTSGATAAMYSTNGGATWTATTLPNASQQTIVYAGSYFITGCTSAYSTGSYSSNGSTWSSWTVPLSSGTLLAFNSTSGNLIGMPSNASNTGFYASVSSAPSAPTLISPANATYNDVSSGLTFTLTYNSTDGQSQNAYAFRIKVSGGSYNYWNAGTNALQSTIVWNSITTTPGSNWTVTLPSSVISNGNVYNWSGASQEAGGSLQGAFASDNTFTAAAAPSVTVTAPVTSATSTTVVVTWSETLGGSSQATYQVEVESGTYSTSPGSGTLQWNSGVVSSSATTVTVGVTLSIGTTYRVFVQIANPGGQTSAWAYSTFTVVGDPPAVPIVTATAYNDPVTGLPEVALAVQGCDNLLTANQASFESDTTTGWNAATNTTIAASAAWSQDGNYSMSMTATAAGAVQAYTAQGTSGFACVAGQIIRAMAFFHSPTTARACTVWIQFYNASGTAIGGWTVGTAVNSTVHGNGAQAWCVATAPAGTATCSILIQGAGLSASEVLYVDSILVAPGYSTSTPYDALVTQLAPTMWMKLADVAGTTTVADWSGNNYTGTVTGTVTFGQSALLPGQPTETSALLAAGNGNSNSIESAIPAATLTQFTVTLAVEGSTWDNTSYNADYLFAAGSTTNGFGIFGENNGLIYGYVNIGGTTTYSSGAVTYNSGTNYITLVYSGSAGTLKIYVNGALIGTATGLASSMSFPGNLWVGGTGTNGSWYRGPLQVAQVAYFTTAFTQTQIQNLQAAASIVNGTWTAGGYVGIQQVTITRSDGALVRNAGWEGVTLSLGSTQTATVYDCEAAPGTAYTYTAQVAGTVSGVTLSSGTSSTSSSVTTNANNLAWLFDPTAPSGALGFPMSPTWLPLEHEVGQLYYPVGAPNASKSTDGSKGTGGTIAIYTSTIAGDTARKALTTSTNVLCLLTPKRGCFYVMHDPSQDTRGSIPFSWEATTTPNNTTNFVVVGAARP